MIAPQAFSKENNLKKSSTDLYNGNSESDLKSIKASSEALAGHIKDDTMDIVHSVAAEGQQQIKGLKSQVRHYMKLMEQEISAKPVQSVAIAFASGFFINLLMRRR